jgi:hypothetical protein
MTLFNNPNKELETTSDGEAEPRNLTPEELEHLELCAWADALVFVGNCRDDMKRQFEIGFKALGGNPALKLPGIEESYNLERAIEIDESRGKIFRYWLREIWRVIEREKVKA